MFTHLEAILLSLAKNVPLEVFAFVASFIEEVIAPIPSPTVMVATGSLAAVQGYALLGLITLAVIAATGKTLGACIVYFVADKMEDVVLDKLGRFFDVTHEDVERLGHKLGNGVRDYFLLTMFRALPFVPSSVVSVGCGLLKVPLRVYIISTFFGTILRDSFYLYFGFAGIQIIGSIIQHSQSLESLIEILVVVIGVALLGYLYIRKRRKTKTLGLS